MRSTRHLRLRHVLKAARAVKQMRGGAFLASRLAEIRALPSKRWRGHAVYRTRCQADFGRGPHTMWLPANALLGLISVSFMRCARHR